LPPTTAGQETERAYSGFGTSKICHLLTYLDTYPLAYSPMTHTGLSPHCVQQLHPDHYILTTTATAVVLLHNED